MLSQPSQPEPAFTRQRPPSTHPPTQAQPRPLLQPCPYLFVILRLQLHRPMATTATIPGTLRRSCAQSAAPSGPCALARRSCCACRRPTPIPETLWTQQMRSNDPMTKMTPRSTKSPGSRSCHRSAPYPILAVLALPGFPKSCAHMRSTRRRTHAFLISQGLLRTDGMAWRLSMYRLVLIVQLQNIGRKVCLLSAH